MSKTFMGRALLALLAAIAASFFLAPVGARADSGKYVNYVLQDAMSEYNAGNWSLYQEKYLTPTDPPAFADPISFSAGLNISNDFTVRGDAYEGARAVSNVRFSKDPARADRENYTLFDTSFVVYQNNKDNRAKDVEFGALLGLPEKNASKNECVYFMLDSFRFFLYDHGEAAEPVYLTETRDNALAGYIEYDFKLEVRLVATSAGELIVYLGFPDGKDVNVAYCKYEGLDFSGYVGYTATSHVAEKTGFSVNFDSIKLSGGTIADYNFTVLSASVDPAPLKTAVVSDKPIALAADIVTSPNLPEYHRAVFRVMKGDAEIKNGNLLYVNGGDEIVLRASSFYDPEIYQEIPFKATELAVSSVAFTNSFEGMTVYTQPFRLIAEVKSNSYVPEHNSVVFEVVSGNAEIFCEKYLKITGSGTVILRATSAYLDDAFATIAFQVTDPDRNYVPREGGEPSCQSNLAAPSAAAALTAIAAAALLVCKKKKA